ncbi:PAQR family membrane homeostasis protein TrhA [Acidiferrobacter thiooxydans]|jgi:hemolysin III|uniref:Hemolysin D n=1 Tax=Acidiferrobacter thiooxydans TaxID=163359 RepID=A0A368HJX8_9GAMM|nr:hemolysin III family protein [Acidiferrobacter thiooxydans]MDA8191338.1 hemolysin III family protein [Gammaproteobacteria bacterium]RCN58325.1 hemolysin D [Acidiferrobacter thiooxydans]UEN99920.1 hemolysin III family protein [Acidiferrobacter thiooxydans]
MNIHPQESRAIGIDAQDPGAPLWQAQGAREAVLGETGDRPQSRAEERANAAIHALGAVLALAAGAALVERAAHTGSPLKMWCAAVSSATMMVVFTVSAIYHILPAGILKDRFQRLDRMMIAVFMAGSYTPVALLMVHAAIGTLLCVIEWGLATLAVALLWGDPGRYACRSEQLYRIMGWITILAARPFFRHTPPAVLAALGLAVTCYGAGVALLVRDRARYLHAAFHLLTLVGGGLQFWAISRVVIS